MRIEKPVIFISHTATDQPIADILKAEIDRVFANGVDVFASSILGTIKPGTDWLSEVKDNLEKAKVVVVLITPVSINRPWIWFEVGASWFRMLEGSGRIYPLCSPEIDFQDLPQPLNRLQALSLGKAEDVKLFFQTLSEEFGFGNMKGFKGSTITKRIPKYSKLKINQTDLSTGSIYSGPYEGYFDAELEEILDEDFLYKGCSNFHKRPILYEDRDSSICLGKLIHYHKLDNLLKLPPGTSKRLIKEVAKRYNLVPDQEWENSIRFKMSEPHEPKKSRGKSR